MPGMEESAPHMVMVVGNRVVGDSRVEKAALSAHAAGYQVTILGLSHRTVERVGLVGPVPVFRVLPAYAHHGAWLLDHPGDTFEEVESTRGLADSARAENRARRLDALAGRRSLHPLVRRATRRLRHPLTEVSRRQGLGLAASRALADRVRSRRLELQSRLPGGWRRSWPLTRDLEDAFADTLVQLAPDLIHVHDVHPLPAASTAADQLRAQGHEVRWVYDAHEWLPGVTYPGPAVQHAAWSAVERSLAPRADAVITVSETLAVKLRSRLRLRSLPRVVTNAPFSRRVPVATGARRDVRTECGLDETTPLLAYAGRISVRRGLATAVLALPALPAVHLAVVASPEVDLRDDLRSLAGEAGVRDRVHIVDYVPAESVTWYLSTATAGISPLSHTAAHHEALATKVREYLHAGLPVVGSDVRAQADFIRESGTGTVFVADDPQDCARAVTALLADLDAHRSAITPEMLGEHSWEQQERVLLEVYGEVLGGPPPRRPPAARRGPRLVSFGPARDGGRTSRLATALARATDVDVEVFGPRRGGDAASVRRSRTAGEADGRPLPEQLDEYRRLVARSSHLVLESFAPLLSGFVGDVEAEVRHLRAAGRHVVVLLHGPEVREPHPGLDASARAKVSRQVRRNRSRVESLDVQVLVSAPDVVATLPGALWLPYVVRGKVTRPTVTSCPRVVALTGPGPEQHRAVKERLEALAASGRIELRRAATPSDALSLLEGAHVLVDDMETGTYGGLACEAMAAGCVVVGHVHESVRRGLPRPLPLVEWTAATFDAVLDTLLADHERRASVGQEGSEYVRQVHDGRRSAAVLAAALGLGEGAATTGPPRPSRRA